MSGIYYREKEEEKRISSRMCSQAQILADSGHDSKLAATARQAGTQTLARSKRISKKAALAAARLDEIPLSLLGDWRDNVGELAKKQGLEALALAAQNVHLVAYENAAFGKTMFEAWLEVFDRVAYRKLEQLPALVDMAATIFSYDIPEAVGVLRERKEKLLANPVRRTNTLHQGWFGEEQSQLG